MASAPVAPAGSEDAQAAKSLNTLVASLTSPKAEVQEKPVASEPPPRPITAPVDAKVAQARLKAMAKDSRRAELTLAEQLGLKVRRVVIDAGHGGHDTGGDRQEGHAGEGRRAGASPRSSRPSSPSAGLEVVLTRDDDTFVAAGGPARLANEAQGDLFISVHCNSAASNEAARASRPTP